MSEALHPAVSRPLQSRFLTIPQAPVCYWLRDRFFELLAGGTLGDVADVCQGLATADDTRFVRFVWEVPPGEWALPVRVRRWVPFEKGGGYGKWFGHHFWAVDWEHAGTRIKRTGRSYVRNEEHYLHEGRTYSWIARGSLGVRWMSDPAIIAGAASSGIYIRPRTRVAAGATMNCRFSSQVVRSIINSDGNGRVARVAASLAMYRGGFKLPEFTSLEEWWGRHRADYYAAFRCLGDIFNPTADITPFLRAHMEAQTPPSAGARSKGTGRAKDLGCSGRRRGLGRARTSRIERGLGCVLW